MPLFIRGPKFMSLVCVEDAVIMRWGPRGQDGEEKTHRYKSPMHAKQEFEAGLAKLRSDGWTLVEGELDFDVPHVEPPDPGQGAVASDPEQEARILADPGAVEPYLVYADWLQSRGDSWGELITVQHALSSSPDSGLRQREAKLLSTLGPRLLGELFKFRGRDRDEDTRQLNLEWRLGFVRKAVMSFMPTEENPDPVKSLGAFLELPVARLLDDLGIGPVPADDDYQMNFGWVFDVLAKKKPRVRTLYVGHPGRWDISGTSVGEASKLWKAMPWLENVTLHGGSMELGKIVAPELRSFTAKTGGFSRLNIDSIATAKWPKLERLEVWFGDPNYGATGDIEDVEPLLAGKNLPACRHLGLKNATFTNELARILPGTKLLPQLQTLDLSLGCLTDAGADLLVAHARAFRHLKTLDVSKNALSDIGVERVTKAFPTALTGEQDEGRGGEGEDAGSRYPAVGE